MAVGYSSLKEPKGMFAMGYISRLFPDEIRRVIRDSNEASAQGSQRYVVWENQAVHSDLTMTS